MSKPQVAVIMMMLKEKIKEDGIYNTLKKLKDMGYNAVEISQVEMSEENITEMKRAIDELGMDICALSAVTENFMPQIKFDTLKDDFDKIVEDAKTLDCKYLRIGMLPVHYMGKEEKYIEFAKELNEYGKRLNEHGMKLFYHNHHFEFERVGGKLAMDILVENSDPEYVGFELDVHWLQAGGQNPIDWIRKLKGRVELVHLKDYRIVTPEKLTGYEDLFKMVQFAEIGEGSLDFEGIIKACEESDVKFMPIEQDMTYGRDVFESLQISMDNLKKMGYSELF
ncbi:sugar phosphate isomerase/epimerase [Clostridium sediminicola]|uniref:sugar phosphate isomerase/epimerase family protein n=1 Tax=Clostridium sediminicola TaxID=3114879 RepID=UPI0031F1CC8B